jgi:hypothetical protein
MHPKLGRLATEVRSVATYPRAGGRAISTYPSPQRRLVVLLTLPLAGGLMIGSALSWPQAGVRALTATQAEQEGTAITIIPRRDLAPGLAEVRVQGWEAASADLGDGRLLALAPGGDLAAVAAQVGPEPAPLILARADGSQLHVTLPGIISASFAPDGSWLAAIDGSGSLWRVEADGGAASRLADGPFLGSPRIADDGAILTLRVASIEAPYSSRLVRVASDGSSVTPVTEDALVYGAEPLDDGSLAVVVHQPSGTQVVRALPGGGRDPIASLGLGAVYVDIARNGSAVAWQRVGEVFVRELPTGATRRIGEGSHPRFAADGRTLLVDQPDGTALVDLGGRTVAIFASQAAFETCGDAGCAP